MVPQAHWSRTLASASNCIHLARFRDHNSVEKTCSNIYNLVIVPYWEDIRAVDEILSKLKRLNILVDVEAQVFTLAEKLSASG